MIRVLYNHKYLKKCIGNNVRKFLSIFNEQKIRMKTSLIFNNNEKYEPQRINNNNEKII